VKQDAAREVARLIATECLAVRVRRLGRVVTRIYDAALAPLGVTTAQLNLLAAIGVGAGTTQTGLGRLLDVEKSTLSRDLKKMEHLGWIRSAAAPTGRGRSISITPAGARLLTQARPAWERAQRAALEQLGHGAFGTLREVLPAPGKR
jgi:DNA-binding MarR family transcriptional regulator